MLLSALSFAFVFASSVAAQSLSVVCVAGQCLQGNSTTIIGATVSAPGAGPDVLLLPGQYTSTTNPQLLHNVVSAQSASLKPSPGFANSSSLSAVVLPLNVALQPGIVSYSSQRYSGAGSFTPLPTSLIGNVSTPLSAESMFLASNMWVAVDFNSNNRVILWDPIPDVSQLPSGSVGSLSFVGMQSTTCSPPCSGSGVCSASGSCTCPTGFNGTSCESCASGFFGPTCKQCPSGCTSCDDGISGSGRCLVAPVINPPSSCNCLNGVCSNGQCNCLPGWVTAQNGTACAKCDTGFFLDSTGSCRVCGIGCAECDNGDFTGTCLTCKSGFTSSSNSTQCVAATQSGSNNVPCRSTEFVSNGVCTPCPLSNSCLTCSGSASSDCITCLSNSVISNGTCVVPDTSGRCPGSGQPANFDKGECDTCGPKCTTCAYPSFNQTVHFNELQCTGCLPGFVLSKGSCISSCPSGTFLSPSDNLTCTACDPSCTTCTGSSTFCLTCANNQLSFGGKCVSSCPSNTVSAGGTCTNCHPDCATCSGPSFNQCSSCSSNLPVLTNGRCLPTCSKSQFFDTSSSVCQPCDQSCSSCSGSGPSNCLACSSSSQVLRGGACVAANCSNSTSIVTGLGVCLSELVAVPPASGTSSGVPLPPGLNTPTNTSASTRRPLAWWEILLMALGCAFIFMVVLMCWRRRARKVRAKRTAAFASSKALDRKDNWRWKLVRFGERLFGHAPSQRVYAQDEPEEIRLKKLRAAEEAREDDMEKLTGNYEHSRAESRRAPSRDSQAFSDSSQGHSIRLSSGSLYSRVTGMPRRTAEPRQPVKNANVLSSRFSMTTLGSDKSQPKLSPLPSTEAEAYAASVRESPEPRGAPWMKTNNPFWK